MEYSVNAKAKVLLVLLILFNILLAWGFYLLLDRYSSQLVYYIKLADRGTKTAVAISPVGISATEQKEY